MSSASISSRCASTPRTSASAYGIGRRGKLGEEIVGGDGRDFELVAEAQCPLARLAPRGHSEPTDGDGAS